jgi:hypothetical protein
MREPTQNGSRAPRQPRRRGRPVVDMAGRRFGRLIVLTLCSERSRWRKAIWACKCDCGAQCAVVGKELRSGRTRSCGCFRREVSRRRMTTHGRSGTRAYRCWRAMLQRCFYSNGQAYSRYGGRGITVCERWLIFENFYRDMGDPLPGQSLDRIDNDGNYEPSNCRWATASQQVLNRRPGKRKRRRSSLAELQAYAASLARAAAATEGAS